MDILTANRLMELRKKHGYSQETLANALGISRQAVSKWERAEASPDTGNLIALAKLYEMSLDELLNGKREGAPSPIEAEGEEKKEEDEEDDFEGKDLGMAILLPVSVLLSVLAFLLVGFLLEQGWHWGWAILLFIPEAASLYEAITKKEPERFLLPVLITQVYCPLGIMLGLWHPWWVLYLLCPLYYGFFGIRKALKKRKEEPKK